VTGGKGSSCVCSLSPREPKLRLSGPDWKSPLLPNSVLTAQLEHVAPISLPGASTRRVVDEYICSSQNPKIICITPWSYTLKSQCLNYRRAKSCASSKCVKNHKKPFFAISGLIFRGFGPQTLYPHAGQIPGPKNRGIKKRAGGQPRRVSGRYMQLPPHCRRSFLSFITRSTYARVCPVPRTTYL